MKLGSNRKRYTIGTLEYLIWQQMKRLMRADARYERGVPAAVKRRITESLEPMREHAELVESDKQNRYAAELWKAHAQAGIHLTEGQRELTRQALIDFGVQTPECAAEVMAILQKLG